MSQPNQGELEARFAGVLDQVRNAAAPGEISAAWLGAERSDFVRFNRGRVRQAGTVEQATLALRLMRDGRQATLDLTLSGQTHRDATSIQEGFVQLRGLLADSEPDPYLALCERPRESRSISAPTLPGQEELCETVCEAAGDADLVGFYAGGPLACGFASSLGHRLWHEGRPWFFDYCVYASGDKAVKSTVAQAQWAPDLIRGSVARARRDAQILLRPPKVLQPGAYRAWLSPTALAEIVGMMNWGGFSLSAQMSGHSPLSRLKEGAARMHPSVSLSDDLAGIGMPCFQADGFERPDNLPLVQQGAFANPLVSPRSGREFGVAGNGAGSGETAEALAMAPGTLDEAQALRSLGTGVSVSNFWYLNWSDRTAARMTGLTRFATLWVENGEPVAPVSVMRFDDSLYRLLGSELEALSSQTHRMPDTQTYAGRSFGAMQVPGALVSQLTFTL